MRSLYVLTAYIWCCALIGTPALAEKKLTTNELKPQSKDPSAKNAVSLAMAIAQALQASSRLKASDAQIGASLGGRQQSALLPNPILGIQVENFAGGGRYGGFKNSEITYGITQMIEIGGKRRERIAASDQSIAQSRHEHEAERLDIIRDVSVAYANAVMADDMMFLSREQKNQAQKLLNEVEWRVRASRESLLQKSMAEINVANVSFAFEKAVRERQHALHVLSSLWGGDEHSLVLDKTEHLTPSEPPTENWLVSELSKNPSFKRMQAEKNRRSSLYQLEKANAFPDLHINIGLRDLRANTELAVVAGLSIPIPLFNRNQGNVARARSEMIAAEGHEQTSAIRLQGQGFEALENMINAYRKVEAIKNTILPSAERAFAISHQGYLTSKYSYVEVLNAERTLFDTKVQNAVALNEYYRAQAEIERLTASRLTGGFTQETSHE